MWLPTNNADDSYDGFLDALGRATALAQNFEANANFALGIAELGYAASNGELPMWEELERRGGEVMRRWLGVAVKKTRPLATIPPAELSAIQKGVAARNYIAHEAARYLAHDEAEQFSERLERFRAAVVDLAAADGLMACWSYEIQEKEPAPADHRRTYPDRVAAWTLAPVVDLLAASAEEPPN